MNILLGISGSVAASVASKLAIALQPYGEVQIILTDKGEALVLPNKAKWLMPSAFKGMEIWRDQDEWDPMWRQKGDRILHTDLKNWADVLVLAPLSANTLGKIANGLADNLLTSVARAWPIKTKPMILVPAMNTDMWGHPVTNEQLEAIKKWDGIRGNRPTVTVVHPQSKLLPCGDEGWGAMAEVKDIVAATIKLFRWEWPLTEVYDSGLFKDSKRPSGNGVPIEGHPGSFGFRRKHDVHTGIDLYCREGTTVRPVESGVVVAIQKFTGNGVAGPDGTAMSWWNDTSAVLVTGVSGVVLYGEIEPNPDLKVGQEVYANNTILGTVTPVLPEGKDRPDIPGHSRSMLHLERYATEAAAQEFSWRGWNLDEPKPPELLDPTPYLLDCLNSNSIPVLRPKPA